MFTGIITEVGTVTRASRSRISIRSRGKVRALRIGQSVAVDGVCLTVAAKRAGLIEADVIPETKRRATLGKKRPGDYVNLELPATPATFLSGHIVQGHIDGVGVIESIVHKGNSRILRFSVPPKLLKYMVEKGSIAINGVSLTIVQVGRKHCVVGIVPHTWKHTSFRSLEVGDAVNIEVDVIAKYVEKLV